MERRQFLATLATGALTSREHRSGDPDDSLTPADVEGEGDTIDDTVDGRSFRVILWYIFWAEFNPTAPTEVPMVFDHDQEQAIDKLFTRDEAIATALAHNGDVLAKGFGDHESFYWAVVVELGPMVTRESRS